MKETDKDSLDLSSRDISSLFVSHLSNSIHWKVPFCDVVWTPRPWCSDFAVLEGRFDWYDDDMSMKQVVFNISSFEGWTMILWTLQWLYAIYAVGQPHAMPFLLSSVNMKRCYVAICLIASFQSFFLHRQHTFWPSVRTEAVDPLAHRDSWWDRCELNKTWN